MTGLSSGTGWIFRIAAVNSVGTSAYSASVNTCTQTCPIDYSFNINSGSGGNGSVSTVAEQSDGKIIYGGIFNVWNGSVVGRIIRLNSNGTVDATFSTNVGTAASGGVSKIIVQPDGKILVAGSFAAWNGTNAGRLVRLNSDGTLDTAFLTATGTGAGGAVSALELQSDGKMILGGDFAVWNGVSVGRIVRINSDGTRDATFTTNTGSGAGSGNSVRSLAVQSDGKVIVGGNFATWNGVSVGGLVRLNSDGTRDTAFSTAMGSGADASGANAIRALAVDSSGRILLGGQFSTWNGVASPAFVRLNSDGSLDSTFMTNLGTGVTTGVNVILVQGDGKIFVGGSFTSWSGGGGTYRARLNDSGSRDSTYATTGLNALSGTVSGGIIDSNGKIVLGGSMLFYGGSAGLPLGYHVRLN